MANIAKKKKKRKLEERIKYLEDWMFTVIKQKKSDGGTVDIEDINSKLVAMRKELKELDGK